jgi:phage terminase small subunit
MKEEQLTQKQRLFVEAYIGDAAGNAREAARMAGYSGDDNALSQRAFELVRNPRIAKLIGVRVEQAVMRANEVLGELSAIAKADWQDFLEIRRDKDGDVIDATLKLSDKIKSLELLGKYHKLFSDRIDVDLNLKDWRNEAQKYGLTEADVIRHTQLLINESVVETGDTERS